MNNKIVRGMRIFRQYFDLIKSGRKTVEVRVGYSSMRSIRVGCYIRFNDDPQCECLVTRVTNYSSFAEMMSREDPQKINPGISAAQQLTDIRRIFSSEKEALGVIAFELRKV